MNESPYNRLPLTGKRIEHMQMSSSRELMVLVHTTVSKSAQSGVQVLLVGQNLVP